MANVNYVSPTAPAQGWKPTGALSGMLYAQDRATYDDQMAMQQYMSMIGAKKDTATLEDYFAERPSKVAANIATNNATTQTIGREKMAGVEEKELGNEFSRRTINTRVADTDLSYRIKEREEQRNQVRRGVEIAATLQAAAMSGTPGAMAQVMQMMPNDPESQKVVNFLRQATSQQDLIQRIRRITDVYKELDMGFQKELLELKAAELKAKADKTKPDWDQKYIQDAYKKYRRQGLSEEEALSKAHEEVLAARAGLQGSRLPTPEAAGATEEARANAKVLAELKGQLAYVQRGTPLYNRIEARIKELEGNRGTQKPPAEKIHSMSELRTMYPGKSDADIKKAYKDKFGVEPQ